MHRRVLYQFHDVYKKFLSHFFVARKRVHRINIFVDVAKSYLSFGSMQLHQASFDDKDEQIFFLPLYRLS